MDIFLYTVTGLLVTTTLLPILRHSHWLVRGMDFPRMQLAGMATFVMMLQLFVLNLTEPLTWALIAVTALCLAWQLWWILPYTRLWKTEVRSSTDTDTRRQIRILTANVLTSNRDVHKLIALVKEYQPDVLVTLESDQWWEDQLKPLEKDMPETIKCPLDNLYGMHVYSRLPLYEKEISFLVEEGVPSMHALLELATGDQIRMHFVHPAPPSPTENTESIERDAELVIVAKSVAGSAQPIIVTGDLNDVAWSRTTRLFRKLSGLLDPRVGRGMFNTFHVDYPLLRWPLDHLFHSDHFTLQNIQRLPSIGSDHFPLLSCLSFTPIKGKGQDGLDADQDDKDFADSIARSQNVSKQEVPEPGE
ncbi:endonuclease/exonuclease/phosphatase family protein [Marinomonas algarum]|uniref:Endonuclease/exonuclease/phosphatase family protein n=1 Tax=Marinomonas algarum TaxID=2883105 RepID=A0A9X1LF86_9GAMM|nr:endonuclease/exonuclease/phosphatase family protein [Marinomonas algarum]MCB5162565.1 endonuclease/exonuclease/phosphatase family protein [Marinomonas algarum]